MVLTRQELLLSPTQLLTVKSSSHPGLWKMWGNMVALVNIHPPYMCTHDSRDLRTTQLVMHMSVEVMDACVCVCMYICKLTTA